MIPVAPTTQLYGFCGTSGSGKNTAANGLRDHTRTTFHSFADALKDGVSSVFGWDRHMVEGVTPDSREWRESPDPYWSAVFERDITPRYALQHVATEMFRAWEPNFWLASAARRVTGAGTHVFTDTRFVNEMQWIQRSGGCIMWVYNPRLWAPTFKDPSDNALVNRVVTSRADLRTYNSLATVGEGRHASEREFLNGGAPLINVVLINSGSQYELQTLARHAAMMHRHLRFPSDHHTLYLSHGESAFQWEWSPTPTTSMLYSHAYSTVDMTLGQL